VITIATEALTPKFLAGLPLQRVQQRSQYLNMLIYGESGVGKTTLAGSADAVPDMRPVLFVDIEGGTESLRAQYPSVETVRVMTWKEMQQVYDELHRGKHGYQTIVLDSLTEIQKFNMYNIMGELVKVRPDLDPDVPGMREWGKNLEQIRRFVRGFRDLPMHTIFTALEVSDKNDRTGEVKLNPMLSGKLKGEIPAFLDIVVYFFMKKVNDEMVRAILCQKTDSHVAKDRTGRLPRTIAKPTMQEIYKYTNIGD